MKLEELVEQFAENVAAQSDAIRRGDARTGNKHAKNYTAALQALRAQGNAGRDALAVLLKHPRTDVRAMAAAFLLRYRTAEAKAVLEAAAKEGGVAAIGATRNKVLSGVSVSAPSTHVTPSGSARLPAALFTNLSNCWTSLATPGPEHSLLLSS